MAILPPDDDDDVDVDVFELALEVERVTALAESTDRLVQLLARRLGIDDFKQLAERAHTDAFRRDMLMCRHCGLDENDGLYMVHDDVWNAATDGDGYGYLHILCLEDLIDRQLTRADFTDARCNWDPMHAARQSAVLRARLTGTSPDRLLSFAAGWDSDEDDE